MERASIQAQVTQHVATMLRTILFLFPCWLWLLLLVVAGVGMVEDAMIPGCLSVSASEVFSFSNPVDYQVIETANQTQVSPPSADSTIAPEI